MQKSLNLIIFPVAKMISTAGYIVFSRFRARVILPPRKKKSFLSPVPPHSARAHCLLSRKSTMTGWQVRSTTAPPLQTLRPWHCHRHARARAHLPGCPITYHRQGHFTEPCRPDEALLVLCAVSPFKVTSLARGLQSADDLASRHTISEGQQRF